MCLQENWIAIHGVEISVNSGDAFPPCYAARSDDLFKNVLFSENVQKNQNRKEKTKFLDVGTGSGILPILWQKYYGASKLNIVAIDCEPKAIATAEKNLIRNGFKRIEGVGEKVFKKQNSDCEISLVQSDLFKEINHNETFDVIVFNGPHCEPPKKNIPKLQNEFQNSYQGLFDEGFANIKGFINGLQTHLKDSGVAILTFSDYSRKKEHSERWQFSERKPKHALEDLFSLLRDNALVGTLMSTQSFVDPFFINKSELLKLSGLDDMSEVPLWYNILVKKKKDNNPNWVTDGFLKSAQQITHIYSSKEPTKKLYLELKTKLETLYRSFCDQLGSYIEENDHLISGFSIPNWGFRAQNDPIYILGSSYGLKCRADIETKCYEKNSDIFLARIRNEDLSKEAKLVIDAFNADGLILELEVNATEGNRFEILPALENDSLRLKAWMAPEETVILLGDDDDSRKDRSKAFQEIELSIRNGIRETTDFKRISKELLPVSISDIKEFEDSIVKVVRGIWLNFFGSGFELKGKRLTYCSFVRTKCRDSDLATTHYTFSTFPPKIFFGGFYHLLESYAQASHLAITTMILNYRRQKHAMRAAAASILSRNMSHNIGSHVLPMIEFPKIVARAQELYNNSIVHKYPGGKSLTRERAYELAIDLRKRMDRYIQSKADYLAEITTQPNYTSKVAHLFKDVLLPFIGNTLLVDNLGNMEGLGYKTFTDPSLKFNYKISSASGANETYLNFNAVEYLHTKKIRLETIPYGWRIVGHLNERLHYIGLSYKDEENTLLDDVDVALPGPIGEYALYGFLENCIRNAAKHNHTKLTTNELEIELILEKTESKEDYNYLYIVDNVTDPDLIQKFETKFKRPIITREGLPRDRNWGLSEMTICANLLAGSNSLEFDGDNLKLLGPNAEAIRRLKTKGRFAYRLRLQKPKMIAVIGKDLYKKVTKKEKESLELRGVLFFKNIEQFEHRNATKKSLFQFALIHSSQIRDLDGKKKIPGRQTFKTGKCHLLPFRIIIVGQKLIDRNDFWITDNPFDQNQLRDPLHLFPWIWQTWLSRWTQLPCSETQKTTLSLYLGQDENQSPTKDMKQSIDACALKANSSYSMQVFGTDKFNERDHKSQDRQILFDRHGMMLNSVAKLKDNDVYIELDQKNPDFSWIFNPPKSAPCLFPFEMIEAGILKVLIIDQRIAQKALEETDNDISISKTKEKLIGEKDRTPLYWYSAMKSGVFIATHLHHCKDISDINEMSTTARCDLGVLHPTSYKNQYSKLKTPNENKKACCPEFRIWYNEDDINIECRPMSPNSDKTKRFDLSEFDITVIHQGVIDNLNRNRDSFLDHINQKTWVVIESGRGVIPILKKRKSKFMPYTLLDQWTSGYRVAKLSMAQVLMSLYFNGENDD